MIPSWVLICLIVFAVIGITATIIFVVRWVLMAWDTMKKLNETLREAVVIAKMFRADFAVLRQIQEIPPPPGPHSSSSSPIPDREEEPIAGFPAPVFDRFVTRKPEPDAPPEDADVSGDDRDHVERDRIESLRDAGYVVEEPGSPPPGRVSDAE